MHNATIWYADGGPYLTFPGNQSAQVVTTTLDGKLVNTLNTPAAGTDLGHPNASDYFAGAGNFVPTDTEYLDGMLYVATGYSKLDYVLTARVFSTNPFKAEWHDMSFGGKGTGVGQFGTGHGITVPAGLQGVSLLSRIGDGGDRSVPPAYSESGRNFYPENRRQYIGGIAGKWRMLRTSLYKVILIPKDPEPIWEIYDLQADPGETNNLIESIPEEAASLQAALVEMVANDPGGNDREEPPLPDELREHLRSLGYVGGSDSE